MKNMQRQMKKMGMDMKEIEIPDEDIEMVANTAGVSLEAAEEALRETGGDLAEAILKLNE